jgi:Lrp/AsnC family transcriptional regulator, leucine-responsive regulatory protein
VNKRHDDRGALDALDTGILEILQVDCKTPLAKIGEKIGLSAAAVIERVRKLEEAGIITGYHAALDGRRLGLFVTAFVGVSVNYQNVVGSLEAQLGKLPELLEMHHITGDHALLLKVKVDSPAALEALLARLRTIGGIERTHTMIALSSPIERGTVAVDPQKRNQPTSGRGK